MSEPNKPSSRQFHFGLLLLLSYLIFNLGLVIDQTLRWSDHWEGFLNGLVHAMFYIVVWGMFLLPWSLVIFLLYYWKKWRRFRSAWVLAPSILILALMLGNLIITPPTVSSRFSWITRSNLPENAENLRYSISGGGIADYYDRYYFETTPSEVERIIEEMELEEDERSSGGFAPLPGAPSSKDWENAQSYRKHESGSSWFYYLTTDESRTKVYICVGCT